MRVLKRSDRPIAVHNNYRRLIALGFHKTASKIIGIDLDDFQGALPEAFCLMLHAAAVSRTFFDAVYFRFDEIRFPKNSRSSVVLTNPEGRLVGYFGHLYCQS